MILTTPYTLRISGDPDTFKFAPRDRKALDSLFLTR